MRTIVKRSNAVSDRHRLLGRARRKPVTRATRRWWYVYMLECANGALYTGVTTDVARRFAEHQAGSAQYTRSNPPVNIRYTERKLNRSNALKREAEIKRWSRDEKLAFLRRHEVHQR
jgi:putative endonuclease